MEETGNYFVLNQLALLTGLTERTLRNYIAMGLLEGEKINGMWHFTPEQVESFISHPTVRPSIQAKQHALVYDFLLEDMKSTREACIILDVPGADPEELSEFFCYRINSGNYQNIRFTFDGFGKVPRVILRGGAGDVLQLVSEYQAGNTPADTVNA